MPTVKYEFDLSNPDDVREHKIYCNAMENYLLLWQLYNNFWRKFKYEPTTADKVLEALQKELEEFKSYD